LEQILRGPLYTWSKSREPAHLSYHYDNPNPKSWPAAHPIAREKRPR